MSRQKRPAVCQSCQQNFEYYLVHNGYNESAYAYCDRCGQTCLTSIYEIPLTKAVELSDYGIVSDEVEFLLNKCPCGGKFKKGASPRCPHCRAEFSAVDDEKNLFQLDAPVVEMGHRGKRLSWNGLYCIVIKKRVFYYDWKAFERSATSITGPRHNWLLLGLADEPKAIAPLVLKMPPNGECRHEPLREDAIIEAVLEGVARANQAFGTGYGVNYLKYVANDTPPETKYGLLAYRIVEQCARAGEPKADG